MKTPRFRFTVMPALVALLIGFCHLPATAIVKVAARGMGFEHEQPWRRPAQNTLRRMCASASLSVARFRERLERITRHALFKPACIAAAILLLDPSSLWMLPLGAVVSEGRHAGEFLISERPGATLPSRESIVVLSGQNLKAGAVIGRVKFGIGRVSIPTVVGTGNGTASLVFAGPEVEVGNYILTCTAAVAHGGVFSLTTPSGKVLPALTLTPGSGGTTAYVSRHINFSITDGGTDFIVGDSFTFVVGTTAPTVIGGTGTGTLSALSLGPDAKPGNYRVINREAISHGGRFEVVAPDGSSLGANFTMSAGSGNATAFTSRQINFTLTDATDFIAGNYFDVAVFNQLAGGKVAAWAPGTYDGRHKATGVLHDNVDASSADTQGVIVTLDAVVREADLEWGASITSAEKAGALRDLAERGIVAR